MKPFFILFFSFIVGLSQASGQSRNLAKNYFDQGEYAKAERIYKKLYAGRQLGSLRLLYDYVETLQAQEKYDLAGELIKQRITKNPGYPALNIKLGYNFQLAGDRQKAERQYKKAMKLIEEQPNYAYSAGVQFQEHNLLGYASAAFEKALEHRQNPNFTIRLAQIYGEQGKLDKMFSTFLNLIEKEPRYFYAVNRNFSKFIKKDPETEANQILRQLLLRRLREEPKVFLNEMLSWLFTKQEQYELAFAQEKAIYRRSEEQDVNGLFDLAKSAAAHGSIATAQDIFDFIIETVPNDRTKLKAYGRKMDLMVSTAGPEDFDEVSGKFKTILNEYGTDRNTLEIQLAYAQFLAFRQDKTEKAKELLQALLAKRLRERDEALVKLKLGDILVMDHKFNQALIYFSQIQSLLKNSDLAQEAGFKVAKTSYYKHDFDWAQTQLNVLKQATSQKIANDAMELSLLISDNSEEDSTHAALKLFSNADFLEYQGKDDQALTALDSILVNYKGDKIEDEALLKKGGILEKKGQYQEAAEVYQKIIDYYGEGILADNAYYFLGKIYENKLNQPEKAQENFRAIVFDFSDSIYYVDARKRFRELRGDAVVE